MKKFIAVLLTLCLLAAAAAAAAEEKQLQKTVLGIRKKYGKNAILKGMNFAQGATTRERNRQVGGHRA